MAPKVVLMTGSSSGIGLAVAKRLALDPDQRFVVIATVIALSEKTDLEAAVGGALNKTVFIKIMDITKDDDITRVVDDVIETHRRIDVLLNIAGAVLVKVPEDVSRQEIDRIFGVNLIGTIRLTQAVLPNMKQRMEGRIITISSLAGRCGWPYGEFYSASKFGLEGFFESLAAGIKAFNIKVCVIEPDAISTAMYNKVMMDTEEYCKTGSLNDIDRRQLSNQMKKKNFSDKTTLMPDDIADVLTTQCLDVDDPAFRHLVCGDDIKAAIARSVSDLSGETVVTMLEEGFKGV